MLEYFKICFPTKAIIAREQSKILWVLTQITEKPQVSWYQVALNWEFSENTINQINQNGLKNEYIITALIFLWMCYITVHGAFKIPHNLLPLNMSTIRGYNSISSTLSFHGLTVHSNYSQWNSWDV